MALFGAAYGSPSAGLSAGRAAFLPPSSLCPATVPIPIPIPTSGYAVGHLRRRRRQALLCHLQGAGLVQLWQRRRSGRIGGGDAQVGPWEPAIGECLVAEEIRLDFFFCILFPSLQSTVQHIKMLYGGIKI
ncbi:hypothetical protein BS78_K264100 [Paspalum vaginatum]|uniref:Uncharacterized protein n=1 Tax=Paspalum vaginatum TaxID=158149 RepID=A0A9W7XA28_9POAL|nr:hypothetical protein BS78_K264100 [Paspalum vaginatum]